MTTLEFADKIGRCPLSFSPERALEVWGYPQIFWQQLVEKRFRMKYGEFLKKELFVPFGNERYRFLCSR